MRRTVWAMPSGAMSLAILAFFVSLLGCCAEVAAAKMMTPSSAHKKKMPSTVRRSSRPHATTPRTHSIPSRIRHCSVGVHPPEQSGG